MKIGKIILAAMLVVSTLSANTGVYLGVGAGFDRTTLPHSTVEISDGGFIEVSIGTTLPNNIGAEVKLTKTVVTTLVSKTIDIDVTTMSFFGTYTYNATSKFSVTPKLGLAYFGTTATNTTSKEIQESNVGLVGGLDFKYIVSDSLNLYTSVTAFSPKSEGVDYDTTHISVGLQHKF